MGNRIIVGQIVKSKSGRDQGRYFLVCRVAPDQNLIFLVDGEKRLLRNPKKKNIHHVQIMKTVAKELGERIREGFLCDQEIKRYLKTF